MNSELLEASTLKSSKETGWSEINIWSLAAVAFFIWTVCSLKVK